MKLIGLEFRVGMQNMHQLEVFVQPVDIVFEWPHRYPFGPQANATLHTSVGDVTAEFDMDVLLRIEPPPQSVSHESIRAAHQSLRRQIERIRK